MKSYHDIQGDGGSNVAGQVEAQQAAIGAALAGVKHVVAIGSGKGGVGKSTLTMAIAQALIQAGRRVAILDGDFNGPCQAQMAGLAETPWVPGARGVVLPRTEAGLGVVSFGSLLSAKRPLEFDSVAPDEEHTWRGTYEFAVLRQLLAGVEWGELDVLLFDLPPGAERTRQLAQALGDLPRPVPFVLVTIPSELARSVVSRSVSALFDNGTDVLGYVDNMAGYYCRDCGEVRPLFPRATTAIDLPCLGSVPFDPGLAELCDLGWPETGDEPPSLQAVRQIARNIFDQLEPN